MKKELMLKYADGCFTDTYTYQCMKELSNEVERLEKQLKRAKDIETTLHCWLQSYKEMTDEQYQCYMSWCRHSDLSPTEIMEKYVFPKVD
jgi:hypothetical protein